MKEEKTFMEARKKERLLVCKQEEIKVGRKKKHSRRKERGAQCESRMREKYQAEISERAGSREQAVFLLMKVERTRKIST